LSNKTDAILAYITNKNNENVSLQELVGNTNENIGVNYIKTLVTMDMETTTITYMADPHMCPINILVVIITPMN
jgi:hypothetical protein